MRRYLVTLQMSIVLTASVWAQDIEPQAGADDSVSAAEEVPAESEEPTEAEEFDDPTLDEQGYAGEEEEDFRPSEEVQADKSITFPTDI